MRAWIGMATAGVIALAGCTPGGPTAPGARSYVAPASEPVLCADGEAGTPFRPVIRPTGTVAATGMVVTPSGGTLLIAGADGATRVWDLATGRQRFVLRPDTDPLALSRALRGGTVPDGAGWRANADLAAGWRADLTRDGRVRIVAADGTTLEVLLTAGGWAVLGEDGRFDGTPEVLQRFTATDGVLSLPLAHFADAYFEPGLLGYRLAGSADLATADSPRLTYGVPAPPGVSVAVEPTPPPGSADGRIRVLVRAEDRGGCIGRVTLFHNGKAVPETGVIADDAEVGGGRAVRTLRFAVPADGSEHRFEAVAASALKVEGERAAATVRTDGTAGRPTLHVLAVGINRYDDPALTLNYAVADADALARRLIDPGGPGALYAKTEVRLITDREATRPAIERALDDLRTTRPEDVVVIYLAGHGENDGDVWHFLPTEFGREVSLPAVARQGISSRTLRDGLGRIGAQRVVLLIDACKSGGLRTAFAAAKDEKYLEWVARTAGVHLLAATAKDQLAVEIESLGHGAFTYALIEGLGGRADRRPADGGIKATDLLAYAADVVPGLALRFGDSEQRPTAFSYGNDFTLASGGR